MKKTDEKECQQRVLHYQSKFSGYTTEEIESLLYHYDGFSQPTIEKSLEAIRMEGLYKTFRSRPDEIDGTEINRIWI